MQLSASLFFVIHNIEFPALNSEYFDRGGWIWLANMWNAFARLIIVYMRSNVNRSASSSLLYARLLDEQPF